MMKNLIKLTLLMGFCATTLFAEQKRPNIVFAIADDWGYHASVLGTKVVKTPTFDMLAETGVMFEHAYVSSPSCTPSRNAVLSGQFHWRLDAGANLYGSLPLEHKVYPHLLKDAGYHIGHWRKSFGPGKVLRDVPPAGPQYKGFDAFLEDRNEGQPFCFWFGTHDPHRGFKLNSGAQSGMNIDEVEVPPYWPNNAKVRGDIADYYLEVQRYDRELGEALDKIEALGELDNTIVVMTSDHGMPFPRCKSNLYDDGARVPLVIRIPGGAAGRKVSDFVSLVDIAPTFLDAAGLDIPDAMSGKSLMPILQKEIPSSWQGRSSMIFGKERHVPCQEGSLAGYPCRAIRTSDFLLIKNYETDRWPSGTPNWQQAFKKNSWLGDCDNGPTKDVVVAMKGKGAEGDRFYQLNFGKRPAYELFDVRKDPHQVDNLADNPEYAAKLKELQELLVTQLKEHGDPRELGGGEKFDAYPYIGGSPTYPGTKKSKKKK